MRPSLLYKTTSMKNILKAEEAAQFAIAIFAISYLPIHFGWWLWPLLFLAPDLSAMGYLINNKVGAATYNLVHHKGVAAVVLAAGLLLSNPVIVVAGLLLWAHSSFDRMLGYGLKYPDAFKNTHLGTIGKA
jgi:hypothetical protein